MCAIVENYGVGGAENPDRINARKAIYAKFKAKLSSKELALTQQIEPNLLQYYRQNIIFLQELCQEAEILISY